MGSQSKEENVLNLFLENSPLKEWHFEEIVRKARVTRNVANKWVKKFVYQGLLFSKKEKKHFPYFTVGSNNTIYYSFKKVYALQEMHNSGLFPALLSQKKVKTAILFGSMSKGDWYKDSDIDIFILGNLADFNRKLYEKRLHRNIELHIFSNLNEIQEVRTGMIKNVLNGYVVKGQIQDFAGAI